MHLATAGGPDRGGQPVKRELRVGTDLAGRPPGCGDAAGYGNIDAAPFAQRSGRNSSGRSKYRGSRCITHGLMNSVAPAGIG